MRKAITEDTPEQDFTKPYTTIELNGGRIEERSIRVAQLKHNELDFPGARSVAVVSRIFINKKTGHTSKEEIAYISSLINPDPQVLLQCIRAHWKIENSLHYSKDVTYREDKQTVRTKNAPFNLALLRSFAISCSALINFQSVPDAIAFWNAAFLNAANLSNSFSYLSA